MIDIDKLVAWINKGFGMAECDNATLSLLLSAINSGVLEVDIKPFEQEGELDE